MTYCTFQQIKTNRKEGIFRVLHACDTRESMRSYPKHPFHQKLKNILYLKRKNRLLIRPNNRGSV